MTKEFLEELELGEEVAETILQRHNQTVQKLQFDHSLQGGWWGRRKEGIGL